MKNRICLKCVSSNKHVSKDCNRDKLECMICQQKHATILHDPTRHEKKDTSQVKSACSQVCGRSQPARSCARIVLLEVFHQDNPSAKVPTYAVLDDQSTDVFVTDSLLEQLGVEGHEVNLEINTITGVNSVRTQEVNGLHIQDIDNLHKSIKVPFAYSQEKIPGSQEDIATPEIARSWKHLEEMAHRIHHEPDVEIGLLIGRNIPSVFQSLRVIYIKEGRKELRRWGLIFTCLCSRAIHLETLNSMETDAFINALRRFINRRGKVRELRCDQGTNFAGGKNELNAALREVNTDSVKNFLVTQDCDLIEFKMNVPSASHMGGTWERLIRTVHSVLSGLLEDHAQQLDDEALRTLFTEAETS